MSLNIVPALSGLESNDFFHKGVYVEDAKLYIHRYVGSVVVVDLENALKTGAEVKKYYLSSDDDSILDLLSQNIRGTVAALKEEPEIFENRAGLNFNVYNYKGVEVFSPFALDRLKPLKSVPKKWNMTHAKKLLANGARVFRTARYTDDYAYDSASNYGAGEVDALEFLNDIVKCNSGWRVWEGGKGDEGYLNISCHHFDNLKIELPEGLVS